MDLNIPVLAQISMCENLLIAGMGGGFDVFCGLPIYFELRQQGRNVHLANYSFSAIKAYKAGIRLSPTLVGIKANSEWRDTYFPELYLAQWFAETGDDETSIWCMQSSGARPLLENYRILIDYLNIDGILLIDGGVDSLARGDEIGVGTIIEDAISLFVVNKLNHVPIRLMGCIGMGAERDIEYAQIFENIAHLTEAGAFLGSCSLAPQMEAYQQYEDAVAYVQGKEHQDPSVINSSIISAVRGNYGDYHITTKTAGSRLWISPLIPIYWFFHLPTVARRSVWLSRLEDTNTVMDAAAEYARHKATRAPRRPASKPLP